MKMTVCALLLGVVAIPVASQSAEERGRSLMEEADRRVSGYGDFTATLTMTLRDEAGSERSREMRIMGLEVPGDGDKTLVIFDRPADLRGTSILTVTHRGGGSQQWLYLPALRRTRRIASSDQADSFMGSQFTYEDMGSQDPQRFRHRYLRDEPLGEYSTHVIERVPTDQSSGYARQVVWLDQQEYRVLRIDYYDREDRPAKSLVLEGYRQYGGWLWQPDRMVMSDHRNGRSTTLEWSGYAFETGLSDEDFDSRRLGRPR